MDERITRSQLGRVCDRILGKFGTLFVGLGHMVQGSGLELFAVLNV